MWLPQYIFKGIILAIKQKQLMPMIFSVVNIGYLLFALIFDLNGKSEIQENKNIYKTDCKYSVNRFIRNIITGALIILIIFLIFIKMIYPKYSNRVIFNGTLKIEKTELKNQFGKKIQLKGISSNGIQWDEQEIINRENLKILRDEWKINVFRIAMYTEENGYIENKERIKHYALCRRNNKYN